MSYLSPQTVLSWNAGEINNAAGNLRSDMERYEGLRVQFTGATALGDAWRGDRGPEAQAVADRLADALGRTATSVLGIADAVSGFAEAVIAAQDAIRAAQAMADSIGSVSVLVDPSGFLSVSTAPSPAPSAAPALAGEMGVTLQAAGASVAAANARLGQILADLEATDAAVASALATSSIELITSVVSPTRQYVPNETGADFRLWALGRESMGAIVSRDGNAISTEEVSSFIAALSRTPRRAQDGEPWADPRIVREPVLSGRIDAEGRPVDIEDGSNGEVSNTELQGLGVYRHKMWTPAALSFLTMQEEAARDGVTLNFTDTYRSLEQQQQLVEEKGLYDPANPEAGGGAVPGTSAHGWGRAIDIDVEADPRTHQWLVENAGRYQFVEDTPGEPWHWSYTPPRN